MADQWWWLDEELGEVVVWHYEENIAMPVGKSVQSMSLLIGKAIYAAVEAEGGTALQGGCGPVGIGATPIDALRDARRTFDGALEQISHMHRKIDSGGGMTSGECAECSWSWPCPTYHVAQGWGDTYHHCEDAGWCEHESVPLPRSAR